VELGSEVLREARLELVCEDDQLESIASLIRRHARTGQAVAGYVVVSDVAQFFVVDGGPRPLAPMPDRRKRT
jgi:nitrogen regulatory protein P-II 1